jgi:hypothetical protein
VGLFTPGINLLTIFQNLGNEFSLSGQNPLSGSSALCPESAARRSPFALTRDILFPILGR